MPNEHHALKHYPALEGIKELKHYAGLKGLKMLIHACHSWLGGFSHFSHIMYAVHTQGHHQPSCTSRELQLLPPFTRVCTPIRSWTVRLPDSAS